MHSSNKLAVLMALILLITLAGCDSTMKIAGEVPPSPTPEPEEVLAQYLVEVHNYQPSHASEVLFLVKFPSCSGSIDRIYEYMDQSDYAHRIRIMGVKDSSMPLTAKYQPLYQSTHTSYRDDHETFGAKTGIRIGDPEMFYLKNGLPTKRQIVNCGNFDSAIQEAESFLKNPSVVLTANG